MELYVFHHEKRAEQISLENICHLKLVFFKVINASNMIDIFRPQQQAHYTWKSFRSPAAGTPNRIQQAHAIYPFHFQFHVNAGVHYFPHHCSKDTLTWIIFRYSFLSTTNGMVCWRGTVSKIFNNNKQIIPQFFLMCHANKNFHCPWMDLLEIMSRYPFSSMVSCISRFQDTILKLLIFFQFISENNNFQ